MGKLRFESTGLILWSLTPCAAMIVGLYTLSSAVWAYGLYHYICLIPAILIFYSLWRGDLKLPSRDFCVAFFVLALMFSALTVLAYELLGPLVISDQKTVELMVKMGWSKEWLWILNIYCFTVNPFLEEIYWRGILFKKLEEIENPPFPFFAIIVSSFLYAFYHYFIFRLILYPVAAELLSLGLFFYGIFLAIVYKRSGSIVNATVAHGLLTDLAVVALIMDLMRKFPGAL